MKDESEPSPRSWNLRKIFLLLGIGVSIAGSFGPVGAPDKEMTSEILVLSLITAILSLTSLQPIGGAPVRAVYHHIRMTIFLVLLATSVANLNDTPQTLLSVIGAALLLAAVLTPPPSPDTASPDPDRPAGE